MRLASGLVMAAVLAGCGLADGVPDVTCAGWQNLAEEERLSIADQIVRSDGLFEHVQVTQHVPPGTPENQLVAMAAGSITKNCEGQRWSPAVRVRELTRDLYAPEGAAGRSIA